MSSSLVHDLIDKGRKLSSVYTLADALNESCGEMDVRGVSHRGYFAAMMTVIDKLQDIPKSIGIDIGGFTTDYLLMRKGMPDMESCDSLERGVITMYNQVISGVNSEYDALAKALPAFSFVLFLGSCTNEEDINNNGYSDKEKAKIETLMNLFDSYGWELDTDRKSVV